MSVTPQFKNNFKKSDIKEKNEEKLVTISKNNFFEEFCCNSREKDVGSKEKNFDM